MFSAPTRIALLGVFIAIGVGHYAARQPQVVYAHTNRCVVEVVSFKPDGERLVVDGSGTGVFINRRGTVLTAAHVVDLSPIATIVTADGVAHKYVRIAVDEKKDLALLVPIKKMRSPCVSVGNQPLIGDTVYVIGFPSGFDKVFTTGMVAGGKFRLVTSAPIAQGSSGGPVLDSVGELIGVVSVFYKPNREVTVWQGFTGSTTYDNLTSFLGEYEPLTSKQR